MLSAYTCVFIFLADGAKGLIDVDIVPPDEEGSSNDDEKRNAVRSRSMLWRNRVVPYVLDASLSMLSSIVLF